MPDNESLSVLAGDTHAWFDGLLFCAARTGRLLKVDATLLEEEAEWRRKSALEHFRLSGANDRASEEAKRAAEFVASVHRRSYFVTVVGVAEHLLARVCEAVAHANGLPFGVGDLKGSGLERIKSYLRKSCDVQDAFADDGWRRANCYYWVRNKIAHQNGELTSSDVSQAASKTSGTVGLGFDSGRVSVSDEGISTAIGDLRGLVEAVIIEADRNLSSEGR